MGLISSGPASAARARAAADQSNHSASSVTTSSRTLLSTSVPATSAARELHNVVGSQPAAATPAHVLDERPAARAGAARTRLADADAVAIELELDLRVGQQAELLAQRMRDRHLSLARQSHGNTLTCKSITRRVIRQFASEPGSHGT